MTTTSTSPRPLAAGLLGLALAAASAASLAAGSATDATRDLYSRISARDRGVLQYVPADGFDELSPGSTAWHRLDAAAFDRLFRSDLRIALHAEDLSESGFGDVAVVTGTRVGSVGPADRPPAEARQPFTMVWTRSGEAGAWQLRHVHLSAPAAPEGR